MGCFKFGGEGGVQGLDGKEHGSKLGPSTCRLVLSTP